MDNSTWTKVGGGRKKPSARGKGKSLVENMPKIESLSPLEVDATTFSAFAEIEERNASRRERDATKPSSSSSSRSQRRRNPKTTDTPRKMPVDVALKQVSLDKLRAVFEDSMNRYSTMPLVWLQDVSLELESQLGSTESIQSPTLASSPESFPLCVASRDLVDGLKEIFQSARLLKKFYWILVQRAAEKESYQLFSWRLLLQILVQSNPNLVQENRNELVALMKSHVKDARTFLSLLWAVGQTSDDDPRPTLKVWLLSVLSLFDTKGISEEAKSYIVEHLKKLIKLAEKSQKKCHDLIDPKDFIVLQKFALDENPNQFRDIYFQLKHLLFDLLPSKRYRNYFTSLLVSVREAKGNHREEILNCLVRCLTEDDHCYNLWTSLHASKNEQTRVLLHYVFGNWCDLRGKLPRQPFKFAVDYFLENELSETWLDEDEDVCLFFHRELAKRRYEARSFGWTRIAFVLSLIFLAVLVSLDIFYLSPSFEDSTSYAVLSTLFSWQWHLLEKAAPTLRLVFARMSFYWDKWSLPIWNAMKKFGLYLEPAWSWLSKKGADLSLMLYDIVGKWTS